MLDGETNMLNLNEKNRRTTHSQIPAETLEQKILEYVIGALGIASMTVVTLLILITF